MLSVSLSYDVCFSYVVFVSHPFHITEPGPPKHKETKLVYMSHFTVKNIRIKNKELPPEKPIQGLLLSIVTEVLLCNIYMII